MTPRLLLFNKPFGVLSQFSGDGTRETLADYVAVPDVYPAGRLDRDSEGLLLLTDDGALQARLSHPRHKLAKTYLVQVEREPDAAALATLGAGVMLDGRRTRPAEVRRVDAPAWLWPRTPPVRFRKQVPTAWLEIRIREGRNRQVRRMSAAVGFPTLRLVRIAVGPYRLHGLAPGAWVDADPAALDAYAAGPRDRHRVDRQSVVRSASGREHASEHTREHTSERAGAHPARGCSR